MRLRLVALAVTSAVLAGCGGGASAGSADPAQALPADAVGYVELVVRPDATERAELERVINRFFDGDAGKQIVERVEEGFEGVPGRVTYAQDIEPWLGRRLGVAVLGFEARPRFVLAAAIRDRGAAEDFVARDDKAEGAVKRSYQDVDYYREGSGTTVGVVGDYLVVARDEQDFKRAVAAESSGRSLATAPAFEASLGKLRGDHVAAGYLDVKRVIASDAPRLSRGAAARLEQATLNGETVAAVARTDGDSVSVDARVTKVPPTSEASPLIRELPAEAWAALAITDVGTPFQQGVDEARAEPGGAMIDRVLGRLGLDLERDLYSWVGDGAAFATGTSAAGVGGAVILTAGDPALARAALPRFARAARRTGLEVRESTLGGRADQSFSIPVPAGPGPVSFAQAGDRVVVAVGERAMDEALEPGATIADDGLYDRAREAVGDLEPYLIVEAPKLLELLDAIVPDDESLAAARPYLTQLGLVAFGAKRDGGDLRTRLTVALK